MRRWGWRSFGGESLAFGRKLSPVNRAARSRLAVCFFFSSRRRHTRFDCDWSSDVCSSDLGTKAREAVDQGEAVQARIRLHIVFDRHGERGPRPVRDIVQDEVPYAEERLVRAHPEPEGMGKGLPRLGKRSTDRLRRRELQRPLTPGREWRLSVHVVRGFHEALKEVLLEAVVDGLGVDGIRGFQSWFFGGRRRRLRRAVRGHGKHPLPLVPGVIISYLIATNATNCYRLTVSVETMK